MTYEWPDNTDDIIDLQAAQKCVEKFTGDKDVDQNYIDKLREFIKECEEYSYDFPYENAIHENYFVEYAEELAENIGMLKDTDKWPLTCIDWEKAAEMLKYDYTEVIFDGASYWIR